MKKTVLIVETHSYYVTVDCDKNTKPEEIEEKALNMVDDDSYHENEDININAIICEDKENENE